jgi:hypothetical protein
MLSQVLTELTSIANAAATAYERDRRARPVLTENGLTLDEVKTALGDPSLDWNVGKALEFKISGESWQTALRVSGLGEVDSMDGLLKLLHKAASAAELIKAGYEPTMVAGQLTWTP